MSNYKLVWENKFGYVNTSKSKPIYAINDIYRLMHWKNGIEKYEVFDIYFATKEDAQKHFNKYYAEHGVYTDTEIKDLEMTNEKITMQNGSTIEFAGERQDKLTGIQDNVMSMPQDDLQYLLVPKDDLKLLKVLDKPIDTETRLVWITRTILFEYSRGKRGCYISLFTLNLITNISKFEVQELIDILEANGYQATFIQNKELIGDCFEIVWG